MSAVAPRVRSELEVLIIETMRRHSTREKLAVLVAEHSPTADGHCTPCHVLGPCLLYTAAVVALSAGRRR